MKKSFDQLFFSKTLDFLDGYLTKQCSRSPHTVTSYRDALSVFRRYVVSTGFSIKTFGFDDCTRDYLLGFMEYLQKTGYEKSSCNQRLAAIKSYMWYVADGDISQQQTALSVARVPFLRTPEKEKETLSQKCLKAFLDAPSNRTRFGVRDKTILILLYDSAIRLSELLSLHVSDINLERGTPYIRIHGKGDKERIVSITDGTVKHVEHYLKLFHSPDPTKTEFLFYTTIHGISGAMSPNNVERIINKYANMIRSQCPDLPEHVHPHMLRRTRATNLYQNDIELELVSRILGHASTQTTRIYAKPSLDMIKNAMDKANPELNNEKPIWLEDEDELARICGLR